MIYVKPSDLWLMLLSTTRYALGHSSYIVSDVCGMLHAFWYEIKSEQREQLCHEIDHELKHVASNGGFLGMEKYHKCWVKFVEEHQK